MPFVNAVPIGTSKIEFLMNKKIFGIFIWPVLVEISADRVLADSARKRFQLNKENLFQLLLIAVANGIARAHYHDI